MNLNLDNKIIIVSGGAKGIGNAIAKILAEENALPIIIGRNEDDNKKAIQEIQDIGGKADFVTTELSQPDECKKAIDEVVKKYGKIDGIVNNAGVNDGVGLENGSYEGFIESYHKNVVHYYLLVHHALHYLKQSKGSIVNIGSKTAETGQGGTSGYAAANGARNALTREWAVELLPYSIRVNAIIVAEAWTPLYQSWISTFENPDEKLKSITFKNSFGKADDNF